eukprot:365727-Chlamydomonas_euryale.AAC.4
MPCRQPECAARVAAHAVNASPASVKTATHELPHTSAAHAQRSNTAKRRRSRCHGLLLAPLVTGTSHTPFTHAYAATHVWGACWIVRRVVAKPPPFPMCVHAGACGVCFAGADAGVVGRSGSSAKGRRC